MNDERVGRPRSKMGRRDCERECERERERERE